MRSVSWPNSVISVLQYRFEVILSGLFRATIELESPSSQGLITVGGLSYRFKSLNHLVNQINRYCVEKYRYFTVI